MGRQWQWAWQHSEQELFQAYDQAADGRLRSRLHALWLLRGGRPLAEVAAIVGGDRTVQTWRSG